MFNKFVNIFSIAKGFGYRKVPFNFFVDIEAGTRH